MFEYNKEQKNLRICDENSGIGYVIKGMYESMPSVAVVDFGLNDKSATAIDEAVGDLNYKEVKLPEFPSARCFIIESPPAYYKIKTILESLGYESFRTARNSAQECVIRQEPVPIANVMRINTLLENHFSAKFSSLLHFSGLSACHNVTTIYETTTGQPFFLTRMQPPYPDNIVARLNEWFSKVNPGVSLFKLYEDDLVEISYIPTKDYLEEVTSYELPTFPVAKITSTIPVELEFSTIPDKATVSRYAAKLTETGAAISCTQNESSSKILLHIPSSGEFLGREFETRLHYATILAEKMFLSSPAYSLLEKTPYHPGISRSTPKGREVIVESTPPRNFAFFRRMSVVAADTVNLLFEGEKEVFVPVPNAPGNYIALKKENRFQTSVYYGVLQNSHLNENEVFAYYPKLFDVQSGGAVCRV